LLLGEDPATDEHLSHGFLDERILRHEGRELKMLSSDDGIERVEVAGFDLRELKAALQHLTVPQQLAVLREVRELCGPTFH